VARDLTVAWELLTAVTRARQHLATGRPMIWAKVRLPTAEHFSILNVAADRGPWRDSSLDQTDAVVIRVSIETLLKDGRRLTSCLDVVAGPNRWMVQPYIMLADPAARLVWTGEMIEHDDSAGFSDFVDSAAQNLVNATLGLDFANIDAL